MLFYLQHLGKYGCGLFVLPGSAKCVSQIIQEHWGLGLKPCCALKALYAFFEVLKAHKRVTAADVNYGDIFFDRQYLIIFENCFRGTAKLNKGAGTVINRINKSWIDE